MPLRRCCSLRWILLIALVGTLLGTVLSIFFAFAAASNIAPRWLRNSVRFMLGLERALPEIVILLFLVAAFGMGPFAGVLSLTIGCIGMLGKLIADAIEELDPVSLESIEAIGATKIQLLVFGVIQQIMPSIISFALFRFELSIRLSVVLGAVGAGGIGLEMYRAFFLLDYPRATTALVVILAMVFITERLSEFLRKKKSRGGIEMKVTSHYTFSPVSYRQRATIFSVMAIVIVAACVFMGFDPSMLFTEFHYVIDLFRK
jgi:phosphonate transport system permease protein